MQVTEAMLQAALQKAVEAGLISRRSIQADAMINREIMQAILQAALAAAHSKERHRSSDSAYRPVRAVANACSGSVALPAGADADLGSTMDASPCTGISAPSRH